MHHRDLIIALIKDDLIHTKLILGLHTMGIDASPYYIRLSETIFQLMNIPPTHEHIFACYLNRLRTMELVDIRDHKSIHTMSESIYDMLKSSIKFSS